MTDLIDRQMAIEAIDNHIFYDDYDSMDKISLINAIRALPSVEKRGRWIDMGDFEQCSICTCTHLKEFQSYYGKTAWIKAPYCPNCGARMEKNNG